MKIDPCSTYFRQEYYKKPTPSNTVSSITTFYPELWPVTLHFTNSFSLHLSKWGTNLNWTVEKITNRMWNIQFKKERHTSSGQFLQRQLTYSLTQMTRVINRIIKRLVDNCHIHGREIQEKLLTITSIYHEQ